LLFQLIFIMDNLKRKQQRSPKNENAPLKTILASQILQTGIVASVKIENPGKAPLCAGCLSLNDQLTKMRKEASEA